MTKRMICVRQFIEVEMDDAKFDADFMAEFVAHFYPFDTLERHAEHLAQRFARGIVDNGQFIEGYGYAADMGIRFRDDAVETELVEVARQSTPTGSAS